MAKPSSFFSAALKRNTGKKSPLCEFAAYLAVVVGMQIPEASTQANDCGRLKRMQWPEVELIPDMGGDIFIYNT